MITKTGEMLVKTGAVYSPVVKAIIAGAKRINAPGFAADKHSITGHDKFVNSVMGALKDKRELDNGFFALGDRNGREIWGNKHSLRHLVEERLAPIRDPKNPIYKKALTPEELESLFNTSLYDGTAGVHTGLSFGSKRARELLGVGGKLRNAQNARGEAYKILRDEGYNQASLDKYLQEAGVVRKDVNHNLYKKFCDENGVQPYIDNMHGVVGINDIGVKAWMPNKHALMTSRPSFGDTRSKLGDVDIWGTMYGKPTNELRDDIVKGRVIHLEDINGRPF